ncbi:hypothetical protein COHA_008110 [Chlorella ohadii]|uniref:Uncharacterized protein n=1 Tax=Chlorella ohadii TaxID=2649997 RepID=A0AAD5H3J3_9CHLO|nr:hypothetical protein COHA_008110 [Chlorella ohadii]
MDLVDELCDPEDYQPDARAAPRLRQEVLALAAALCRLAAALPAPPLPLPSSPTSEEFQDAAHLQVLAASWALSHCALLGRKLDLPGDQAFRVAAAAQLVLQAGPWSLAVGRAACEQNGQQEAPFALLAECCAAFSTALLTVSEMLLLGPVRHDAAAAFAGSTARPDALLPWLREMAQTLLALPTDFADDSRATQYMHRALRTVGQFVAAVTVGPKWASHAAAIQADAALQQALADVLLPRSLVALVPKLAELAEQGDAPSVAKLHQLLTLLNGALHSECLVPALQRRMQHGGSLVASVAAAADILQLLPVQCSPAPAQLDLAWLWTGALEVAGNLASLAASQHPIQPPGMFVWGGASRQECQQVAALILQSLPQLATALEAAAVGSTGATADGQSWAQALAAWCANMAVVVRAARDVGDMPAPLEAYVTCSEAAVAALRLVPLLVQINAALMQLTEPTWQPSAARLAVQLWRVVQLAVFSLGTSQQVRAAAAACGRRQLAVSVTHLHTQLCRLVHYLARGGTVLAGEPQWGRLLNFVHNTFASAAELRGVPPLGQDPSPDICAMCAAQWAAVQAVTGVVAAPERAAQNPQDTKDAAQLAALSLMEIADIWPAFVTARFLQPVDTALRPLLQDTSNWLWLASLLLTFAERLEAGRGNLAYSFAHTGMLALAVRCGLRLFELGPETYSQVWQRADLASTVAAAVQVMSPTSS